MTLPSPPSISREIALALQHADRVTELSMETLGIASSSRATHAEAELALLWMVNAQDVGRVSSAWNESGKVRSCDPFVLSTHSRLQFTNLKHLERK